jgi:hypothetical protein
VRSNGVALVKLRCHGRGKCSGELTLIARAAATARGHRRSRTVTIATSTFSIAGESTKAVTVRLTSLGRGLLRTARGHLSASLSLALHEATSSLANHTIVELVESPSHRSHGHKLA